MSVLLEMGCGNSRPITKKKRHFLGINLKSAPIIIIPQEESGLFEDPEFQYLQEHADNDPSKNTPLQWLRPHQMVPNPALYVDGTSRRDVIQGILGDCWLLSTCAALAKKEELLHRVLPPDQPLFGPDYR